MFLMFFCLSSLSSFIYNPVDTVLLECQPILVMKRNSSLVIPFNSEDTNLNRITEH